MRKVEPWTSEHIPVERLPLDAFIVNFYSVRRFCAMLLHQVIVKQRLPRSSQIIPGSNPPPSHSHHQIFIDHLGRSRRPSLSGIEGSACLLDIDAARRITARAPAARPGPVFVLVGAKANVHVSCPLGHTSSHQRQTEKNNALLFRNSLAMCLIPTLR
jgi:hypothetical protein